MSQTGKYLYGITDAKKNQIKETTADLKGINDGVITPIPYQNLTALVSDSPMINFDTVGKKKLHQFVAIHKKTVEDLAKQLDIIPMRFGMIVKKEKELVYILKRAQFQFVLALDKIRDKAEFILQILWDKQTLLQEIGENTWAGETFGKRSDLDSKVKLGKMAFETLKEYQDEYISDIQENLKKVAIDICPSKLIDQNMILNLSLLIEKDQESVLDKIINQLAEEYSKLKFRYWGPLPAYSFVRVDLKIGDFELINRARKRLQLPKEATLVEIKQSYRRLSIVHHPDKKGSEDEMKRVAEAYKMLENYCLHHAHSFRRRDVDKVVINKTN